MENANTMLWSSTLISLAMLGVASWRARSAEKQAEASLTSALEALRSFHCNIAMEASLVEFPSETNERKFSPSIKTVNATEKPIIFRGISATVEECDSDGKTTFNHGNQEFLKSIKSVETIQDFPSELKLKWAGSPRLRVTIYAKVQIAGEIQEFREESQTLWLT